MAAIIKAAPPSPLDSLQIPFETVDSHALIPNLDITYDLKEGAALPVGVLPVFEPPVSRWTMQVVRVLISMGFKSFKGENVSKAVIPLLLAKLPPEVGDMMPLGTLQDALDFLIAYDKKGPLLIFFPGCPLEVQDLRSPMREQQQTWLLHGRV